MRHVMLIIAMFLLGCSTTFTPADLDVDDDGPEDGIEEVHLDVPVDPRQDADDGPVEPEGPCGGPTDDCDEDGVTPDSGDCCDDDPLVHPGQETWFAVPFYCPDESWDYNCDGDEELEYESTSTLPVNCYELLDRDICDPTQGWEDGTPECGSVAHFVYCAWSSSGGHCYENADYEGLVRCR